MRFPSFIAARGLFTRILNRPMQGRIQPLDLRDQQLLERHRARRAAERDARQEVRP